MNVALIGSGIWCAVVAAIRLGASTRSVIRVLPLPAVCLVLGSVVRTQPYAYPLFGVVVYLLVGGVTVLVALVVARTFGGGEASLERSYPQAALVAVRAEAADPSVRVFADERFAANARRVTAGAAQRGWRQPVAERISRRCCDTRAVQLPGAR